MSRPERNAQYPIMDRIQTVISSIDGYYQSNDVNGFPGNSGFVFSQPTSRSTFSLDLDTIKLQPVQIIMNMQNTQTLAIMNGGVSEYLIS